MRSYSRRSEWREPFRTLQYYYRKWALHLCVVFCNGLYEDQRRWLTEGSEDAEITWLDDTKNQVRDAEPSYGLLLLKESRCSRRSNAVEEPYVSEPRPLSQQCFLHRGRV